MIKNNIKLFLNFLVSIHYQYNFYMNSNNKIHKSLIKLLLSEDYPLPDPQ